MPFKSEKQRRYMYANEPAIAKKWSKKYGDKIKKFKGGGMDASQDDFGSPSGKSGKGSDHTHTRFEVGSGYYGEKTTKSGGKGGNKPPVPTTKNPRPHYKPINIPVIGPATYVANKALNYIGVKAYDANKTKRDKFAKDTGLTRDHYKTTGKTLDVMDPTNKDLMKEAGYSPFQDKKVDKGGGEPQQLCPDGTKPPCVVKSQGTAAPMVETKKAKFLEGFKAYNKGGGVPYGPPPLRGPNPQVPPVKLRKGNLTKTYKMSCPHRPDGIRGVGKAIRGHKFIGVR